MTLSFAALVTSTSHTGGTMAQHFVEVPGKRSASKGAGYPLGAVWRGAVEDTGRAVRWPPTLPNTPQLLSSTLYKSGSITERFE